MKAFPCIVAALCVALSGGLALAETSKDAALI
jgi:hypothetical protein